MGTVEGSQDFPGLAQGRKDKIYRGYRLVNWDPSLKTAVSDLEVVRQEKDGLLWHIKYPIEDSEEYVIVATTRPETMFGDMAVAVNPNDDTYKNLIGKNIILPFVGRKIPVLADEYVDMEFGTGCLKITPDFSTEVSISFKSTHLKANIFGVCC